jgi:hypothetical protein
MNVQKPNKSYRGPKTKARPPKKFAGNCHSSQQLSPRSGEARRTHLYLPRKAGVGVKPIAIGRQ